MLFFCKGPRSVYTLGWFASRAPLFAACESRSHGYRSRGSCCLWRTLVRAVSRNLRRGHWCGKIGPSHCRALIKVYSRLLPISVFLLERSPRQVSSCLRTLCSFGMPIKDAQKQDVWNSSHKIYLVICYRAKIEAMDEGIRRIFTESEDTVAQLENRPAQP